MIILLILGFAVSLYCLGLAFTLAARALPVSMALCTGFLLHHLGAGAVISCLCALVTGTLVISVSQNLIHHATCPVTRALTIVTVIMPAAWAGYQLTLGLGRLVIESAFALHALALIGAVIVSRMAWQRLVLRSLS